jgi:hypothetical protein
MNKFWLIFGLTACIAPNASLQVSDTDDIGLVDTDNTDDTNDTQDTEETGDTEDTSVDELVLTEDGLFAVRNQYLLMDGSIGLKLQLELNRQGVPNPNQGLANFLRSGFDWGMGITMGAYNEESFDHLIGERLSLVRANGALLSLNWVSVGNTGEYRPLIYLNRYDAPFSNVCAEAIYGSQTDDVVLTEEVLREGYHLVVVHRDLSEGAGSNITAYIYTNQTGTGEFLEVFSSTPSGDNTCVMETVFEETIVFGVGLEVDDLEVSSLQLRIDDLLLFNGLGTQSLLSLNASDRLDKLSSLYMDQDGTTDLWPGNENEDGWYWYPVDPSPPHIQNGEYQQVWDETVVLGNDNYTLEIIGSDGAVKSSAEALDYYYEGNTNWSAE